MSPAQHCLKTIIGLSLLLSSCTSPPSLDRLLAQAYQADRRFDWQLANTGWSATKAKPASALDRPAALVQAQARLATQDDPLLAGRADLIEARVDAALARLSAATRPEHLIDLAVAHGLSADRGGPAAGYAAAIEHTTRALAAEPNNARALFNRALAFERLWLLQQADDDWARYLTHETDAAWRNEATKRRADLQSRRAAQNDTEAQAIQALVENRAQATALAQHNPWLADAAREPVDSQLLRDLMKRIESGQASEALLLAPDVARVYASAPAHRLQAEFELLFAQNRRMETCAPPAAQLARQARRRGYLLLALRSELVEAGCLNMSGPPDRAIARARQVEAEAKRLGLASMEARASTYRTNMQTNAGDVWTTFEEDRRTLEALHRTGQPARRRHLIAVNYQTAAGLRGWHAAAYQFGLAAGAIAAEIPNRVLEASNRYAAATSAMAASFSAAATREAAAAREIYSQLKESPERRRYIAALSVLEGRSLWQGGNAARAVAVLTAARPHLRTGDDQLAVNEALGLAYLQLGRTQEARTQLEACLAALRATQAPERRRLLAQHRDAYRALARLLLDANDPEGALRIWLEAHNSPSTPDLVWLALPNGYAVWTQGKLQRLTLDREKIRQHTTELARAAAMPDSSLGTLRQQAQTLFNALIAPLPNWKQPNLTVLPDGELAEIPLHLLVTPDGDWWGFKRTLLHAAHQHKLTWTKPTTALAVGVSAGPAHLPPLPDSAAEARQVASYWPNTTTLLDAQATAEALRQHLPRAGLFHFSGHGWASADLGGVHLADSVLTPLTLSTSLKENQLTVLSACFTAAGTNTGLANPDSLVRALLDAGAGMVLASRWAIDSAATRRWMAVFYAQLGAGQDPASALQTANEAMEKEFAHPYFWAAFQLYQ